MISSSAKPATLKSLKKIIKKLFIFGIIFIFIVYIALFLYFQFGWKIHYPELKVGNLITQINKAPTLTDSLYWVYDKIYKDRHEHITIRYLKDFWTEPFLGHNGHKNWQKEITYEQPYKGHGSLRYGFAFMALAFRINRGASPEKCFDYIMAELYPQYCREFKIIDTITNLKGTDQIIKFLVAKDNPWKYRTHPDMYKQEVDSIKEMLKSN